MICEHDHDFFFVDFFLYIWPIWTKNLVQHHEAIGF